MKITLIVSTLLLYIGFTSCSQNISADNLPVELMMEIPFTDSTGYTNADAITLAEDEWEQFQLNTIEPYDHQFIYQVHGYRAINKCTLILISRNHSDEMIHWIAIYNKNRELIDVIRSAYDNSEGSVFIRSEVSAEQITTSEWNLYLEEEPQISILKFSDKCN